MLSVCIPVYNKDIRPLIETLLCQIRHLAVAAEILVIDDASDNRIQQLNRQIARRQQVRYQELPANIGRAKIRNMLAKLAAYEWMLVLDCNVAIPSAAFLQHYLDAFSTKCSVICGGQTYPENPPARKYRLRYTYGRKIEARSAAFRKQHPNVSFRTKNFAIRKQVFLAYPLEERLTGYGHEDTLFGWRLGHAGIVICHIDNPVLHYEFDTNREFLNNTRQSIQQLFRLQNLEDVSPDFFDTIRLARFARKIRKPVLLWIVQTAFRIAEPLINLYLIAGGRNLRMLDFYKLGWYLRLQQKEQVVEFRKI